VAGVRGAIGKTGWDYDVVTSRSDSKGTYSAETYLTDRLKKSMDVVASGSGYACRDSSGGCVAAPAITPSFLKNYATQTDWLNYVVVPTVGITKFKEDTLTATTTGTLFSMPAGKAKAAFGAEIRSNSINDQPAPESVASNLYLLFKLTSNSRK
jgi:iron complex outermembrane recepter protein